MKLSGNVNQPYKLKENEMVIPSNAVVDSTSIIKGTAIRDDVNKVKGPRDDGSLDGQTYEFTTLKNVSMESATRFTVHYSQDFNYLGVFDDLEAYGARVTVYHAAWMVDISSKTYEYEPAKLVVTYEGDAPPVYTVTGDYDILPSSTINWRDSFSLKPKNFVIPEACKYLYHEYLIEKDGIYWTSKKISSQSETTSFSYSSYPSNIGVGSNYIQIKVTADCADSGWTAGKYLQINTPSSNQPPQFSAGFFKEYNRSGIVPDYEVVVNSYVNLRVINDNTKVPAWPYDPEGDSITYTWLFSASNSSWIRSLPSEYGAWEHDEYFYNLKATELGYHSIKVIARDSFGAESSRIVSINVIPENPIPIIDGPTEVKENRPLPKPISGSRSYSPVSGRTIAQYIWDNKKDKYTTPGTEIIKLDVVDSVGLKSLSPAVHTLTVLPDDPPVGVLEVPPLGIRGGSFDIFNKSYSPDGDKIASIVYRYKYDANNNGFDDDAWQSKSGEATKTVLNPTKVGKYLFDAQVCEDWGKCAWVSDTQPESSRILDVVNQAPSVSFLIEGKNEVPEPPTNNTGIPASTIIKDWALYDVNSTTPLTKKPYMWSTDNGRLLAGLGKGMEKQYYFLKYMYYGNNASEAYRLFPMLSDNGYGPNSISPYRALSSRDAERSGPILIPMKGTYSVSYTTGEDYSSLAPAKFATALRTNDKYIYFDQVQNEYDYEREDDYPVTYVFALNKNRIPRTQVTTEHITNGYAWTVRQVYKWLDPNPYDFILKLPRYAEYTVPYFTEMDQWRDYNWKTKAEKGDYSGASSTYTAKTMYYSGFEISGSRIYAVYYGTKAKYAYYYRDSEGDSSVEYNWDPNARALEVRIYDAFTGQYLGSSLDVNSTRIKDYGFAYSDLSLKGENLVIRTRDAANKYVEYDRSGKIVSSGSTPLNSISVSYALKYRNFFGQPVTPDPANYLCTFGGPIGEWKDDKGNSYSYRQTTCYLNGNTSNPVTSYDTGLNPDFPQGVYLVQIKSDHTLGFVARLPGTAIYKPAGPFYDINIESDPLLGINPATSQAVTRSFTVDWCSVCMYPNITQHNSVVNLNTGAVSAWGSPLLEKLDNIGQGFYMTHTGSTGGGWRTNSASGTLDKFDFHQGQMMTMEATNYTYNESGATYIRMGEYVGDGMWLSIYGGDTVMSAPGFSQGYTTQDAWMFLDVGTANPTQAIRTFQFGQFVSPASYTDAEYTFTINMDMPTANTKLAGLSFRMTDPRNRYAVEVDGTALYLSKYVNGSRTILASIAYPFQPKTDYAFKIIAQGNRIQVFMNGVPYFDKTDTTFSSGKFGPFSDKSYVNFTNINQKDIKEADVNWLTNYAIWENGTAQAEVRYTNIVFDDPEKDPRAGSHQWTIQHAPKFLNNQGLSALHGQTLTSPALKFDKVGNYRVTLKAQDDPNPSHLFPSNVFADYRKWSNDYWQIITVHRRPIAQFTLSVEPNDHTVTWNDQSYDPDRWQNPTVYDTEPTGINYQTTRGVTERKYYYVTPSGSTVNNKLVTPQEVGTYKVGLQVKDDFGAWSYWAEQEIEIDTPVIPDDPPVPGFNLSRTTLYHGESLTITSTAYDKEDGPAGNLQHEYYIRNLTTGSSETLQSTSRGTWNKVFNSIGEMELRQVVYDSKGQSAQLIRRVTVLNRAPTADFTWSPQPAYEGDEITVTNLSADPDGDSLTYAWSVTGPNGYRQSGSTKNIVISGSQTLNRPGAYQVTLSVRDSSDASDTVTKTIVVRELGIQGSVLHTDAWEENRIRYNNKFPDDPRPPDMFWAGEAFRLVAVVTDTGQSATKPVSVEAAASAELRKMLAAASSDLVRWEGLLRSEDAGIPLDELPQGPYTFVFTVRFSNGAVKTHAVTIRLKDTVHHYVQVHRVQ